MDSVLISNAHPTAARAGAADAAKGVRHGSATKRRTGTASPVNILL